MESRSQKAFTLIELLVTAAVIGLVASVVLVVFDLPGRKRQARLAKTLEFSQSMQNAIGDELVGSWTFENVSGGKTPDMSGNKNDGAIVGATQVAGMNVVSGAGTGQALSFDGNDYVTALNSPSLTISGNAMTISCWIKTAAAMYNNGIVGKNKSDGTQGWELIFATNLRFYVSIAGSPKVINAAKTYNDGNWHLITAVYDGAKLIFYGDGGATEITNSAAISGNITASTNNLVIGTYYGGGYFTGLVDDLRLYNRALTLGEIQKQYARGRGFPQALAVDKTAN